MTATGPAIGSASEPGRYLVLFADDAVEDGARTMTSVAGIRTMRGAEFTAQAHVETDTDVDGVLWEDLGVAVVSAASDQISALGEVTGSLGPITMVEPERAVYALALTAPHPPTRTVTEESYTWGLRAVRADVSTVTGAGVRVCVLDTGFDIDHPDFADRMIVAKSFVDGEDTTDVHGHGTHVTGTVCGPRQPADYPAYGVAPGAEIYVGKVLDNSGAGTDGSILAGIAWALQNGCAVVSMSLGAPVRPGQPYSVTFERAARRALDKGTLIVAAAGNDSKRTSGLIAPVSPPANCPSIMAVGAIDAELAVADFSSGTVERTGAVDVVAPGVDVLSAWPMPQRVNTISGTSMATPHVTGVAALLAEKYHCAGWALWARLTQSAMRLPLPSTDVGAGLVQAPG